MKLCGARERLHLEESKLSTDISSSTSSQWMPMPPPIRRQFFLCSLVAFNKRGNQARGAESSRPSARLTCNATVLTDTSTAKGSTFIAKVLMPFLLQQVLIVFNYTIDFIKLKVLKSF